MAEPLPVTPQIHLTSCISGCQYSHRLHETFEKRLLKLFFSAISVAKRAFARGSIEETEDSQVAGVDLGRVAVPVRHSHYVYN